MTNSSDVTPIAAQPYVKVYCGRCDLEDRAFIELFHDWVKHDKTDTLLIDVHDYTHVHEGPGVILVGHEAHYGMDRRDGRLGLVYRARRNEAAPVAASLASAAQAALQACQIMEQDAGDAVTFATDELLVGFEDRLRAPNDSATFAAFAPELGALARRLLGDAATVRPAGEARDVFSAQLRGPGRPLTELVAALV